MAISIVTSSEIFNYKQNIIIVFGSFSGETEVIKNDNFTFIYIDKILVGINIFDYEGELGEIKEGYHHFSNENFLKIVQKFPKEMSKVKNISFFRIGVITEIQNHPKSDKLKILTVETKEEAKINIITNLSNLKVGEKHLFATNGAFLATGMIINESKVMGAISQGMICSYKSIGVDKEGIILIEGQEVSEEYIF